MKSRMVVWVQNGCQCVGYSHSWPPGCLGAAQHHEMISGMYRYPGAWLLAYWCHPRPPVLPMTLPTTVLGVNLFFVVKGFVVHRCCLIIIRSRWFLCCVSLQTVIKTFADIFLAPMRLAPHHKSWLRNALAVCKHIPPYPRLTIKLSQLPLGDAEYSCTCSGPTSAWSHPVCKLPYNKRIHRLHGAACLILQPQDTFSVRWTLFVPSVLRHYRKDQNSKREVRSLMNAYCFFTIIK